ncbi:MAG: DUF1801 domain-containing protein [Acidobacteria bacterium]|nr:DUF1801 domain-containing protein [Acidobacteriota bacterium]
MTKRPASVDEYIARFDPRVRDVLQRMRQTIQRALPRAEEGIGYSMPAYRVDGRVVIYFAAWKEHVAIYPATGSVTEVFRQALAPYEVSKGTIRFPLDEPVPMRLIAAVAKLRAAETVTKAGPKRPVRSAAGKRPAARGERIVRQPRRPARSSRR